MKTFEKQFNIKTKLETLDRYVRSILNKFDPDDEIEVKVQEFDRKQIVNVSRRLRRENGFQWITHRSPPSIIFEKGCDIEKGPPRNRDYVKVPPPMPDPLRSHI